MYRSHLPSVVFCLLLLLSALARAADDDTLATSCERLRLLQDRLISDTQQYEKRLQALALLERTGAAGSGGLRYLFPVRLDLPRAFERWWKEESEALPLLTLTSPEQRFCQAYKTPLDNARQQYQSAHQDWIRSVERWRQLPVPVRRGLERVFDVQERLQRMQSADQASGTPVLGLWLDRALETSARLSRHGLSPGYLPLRTAWRDSLQLSPAAADAGAIPGDAEADSDAETYRLEADVLHRDLKVAATRLRNARLNDTEAPGFFSGLAERPVQWLEDLYLEARFLPALAFDSLIKSGQSDYLDARRNDQVPELLAYWVLALGGLIVYLGFLQYLGGRLRSALTLWQQKLFRSLQDEKALTALRGLFWLLKPNSDWLLVLLGTHLAAHWLPEEGLITNLIIPVGNTLALYLGARVAREWWGTRMFGRSNQFLSGSQSEDLLRSSRHFAFIVTLFYLAYEVIDSAGGGRLYPILLATLILTLWFSGAAYCRAHRKPINAFLVRLLPAAWTEAGAAALERPSVQLFYPLWMVLGQAFDILLVVHQHLLKFDSYRRLATRLLRLRLESANAADADDDADTQNGESEYGYSHWFKERSSLDTGLIRQTELSEALFPPLNRWIRKSNPDNCLLITGHQGMGKSTALQLLEKKWEESPVHRLTPEGKVDTAAAVNELLAPLEESETGVVLLDRLEDFFLSDVGHFEGVRALLDHVTSRKSRHFWVLAAHRPAWEYLSWVFRREYRILSHLMLPRWSASDIRKLILSRHHRSQYRLRYDEMLLAASAVSDAANFRAAESRVFNLLWEQCNGNPEVALQLWLEASQKGRGREIIVGMPNRPPLTQLADVSDDSCFVYNALIRHRQLNSEEISACTHLPMAIVRHALTQGQLLGVLGENEAQRFEIRPMWYSTLTTLLVRKNMIYG